MRFSRSVRSGQRSFTFLAGESLQAKNSSAKPNGRVIGSKEDCLDAEEMLSSLGAARNDLDAVFRGFDREFDQLGEALCKHKPRMCACQETLIQLLKRDQTDATALKRLESRWAREQEELRNRFRSLRALAGKLGEPINGLEDPDMSMLPMNYVQEVTDRIGRDPDAACRELREVEKSWRIEKTIIEELARRVRILHCAVGLPESEFESILMPTSLLFGVRTFHPAK